VQSNYFEIERNLQIAIDDGKEIELISFSLEDDIETDLRMALDKVLSRYERASLVDLLFSCLLELATNGTKANMKQIYFEENGWNLAEEDGYQDRLAHFKKGSMQGSWIKQYSVKARERGLFVKIQIRHAPEGLHIAVINTHPLTSTDRARIEEKISLALRYQNIVEYHMQHGDDSEGQGLGLALAILILRSNGIDPQHLWIETSATETIAHLEIPLSEEFKSRRTESPEGG